MENELLIAALDYAARGWHVLPVRPKEKLPLIQDWPNQATVDAEKIKAWWKQWPAANIGVLLGQKSGLVVLDIDGPAGFDHIKKMRLPETITATSGKEHGHHCFYKAPSFPVKKQVRLFDEVDLLAENSFVIVAPSVHPSGRQYKFDNLNGKDPAPLPSAILNILDGKKIKVESITSTETIPSGQRNETLTTWAGKMRRIGLGCSAILAALQDMNRACDPPLNDRELETIARSVGKYEPGQAPLPPESAEALMTKTFEPIRWTAKPILAEGLGMLAGPPKIGKSWLALNLALAVATGQRFLGEYAADQGRALFLGLEDGPRRLQDRLKMLLDGSSPFGGERPCLDLLDYSTTIPKSTEGGLEFMDGWLAAHRDARLIVIDTLARLRRAPGRNANAYLSDTDFMAPLQKLALDHRCCILLVHHTRKGQALDPLDAISGTTGLAGVADQCWILKRESRGKAEAVLEITGRDFESVDIGLNSNEKMQWTFQGNAADLQKTRERQEIVDFLSENAGAIFSTSAIAKALEKNIKAVSFLLGILVKDGIVLSGGYGKYYISKEHR